MNKQELINFLDWLKSEPDFNITDGDIHEIVDDYFFFLKQNEKDLAIEIIESDEELELCNDLPYTKIKTLEQYIDYCNKLENILENGDESDKTEKEINLLTELIERYQDLNYNFNSNEKSGQ